MKLNRVKDFLLPTDSPTDYQRLFEAPENKQIIQWVDSCAILDLRVQVEKHRGLSEKGIGEAVKTAVHQILKDLSRQAIESEITQLQQKIVELEKRNKELDDKLNSLSRLLLPFREILEEEKQIEEKLQKEMPELKFEKQDPFTLGKGGWAVPYERLKELLEEE